MLTAQYITPYGAAQKMNECAAADMQQDVSPKSTGRRGHLHRQPRSAAMVLKHKRREVLLMQS